MKSCCRIWEEAIRVDVITEKEAVCPRYLFEKGGEKIKGINFCIHCGEKLNDKLELPERFHHPENVTMDKINKIIDYLEARENKT